VNSKPLTGPDNPRLSQSYRGYRIMSPGLGPVSTSDKCRSDRNFPAKVTGAISHSGRVRNVDHGLTAHGGTLRCEGGGLTRKENAIRRSFRRRERSQISMESVFGTVFRPQQWTPTIVSELPRIRDSDPDYLTGREPTMKDYPLVFWRRLPIRTGRDIGDADQSAK